MPTSPGTYRWQVRALTADGVPSEHPATLQFTILPHLWQRWWLQSLLAAALCAVLYSLYRYRLDRLLELERLRTRIATDLHDDIGSTLSQIAILSEVAQRQPNGGFGQPLNEIAGLSRELVDSMSDIVWAIDPEQDRLEDLSHRMRRLANDMFSYNGVDVRFQGPNSDPGLRCDAEIRRQVFLIFKEALHNAVRHSHCQRVELRIEQEGGWLRLALADDGTGLDPEKARRGHGLASMRQRAEQAGGRLTVESAPGRGSRLEVYIPVRRRPAAPHAIPHKWVGDFQRISDILRNWEK
jgi:signal transduction histidine kinase